MTKIKEGQWVASLMTLAQSWGGVVSERWEKE